MCVYVCVCVCVCFLVGCLVLALMHFFSVDHAAKYPERHGTSIYALSEQ